MNFFIIFYYVLILLTSQILAMNLRNERNYLRLIPDDKELEMLQHKLKTATGLDEKNLIMEAGFERTIKKETTSSDERKLLKTKEGSSWWPSKVDRLNILKNIQHKPSSESSNRDKKRPATFEEVENKNSNIYNPLLNLDHYPLPSKKYTFTELENMNANHYNPYLN